MKPDSVKGAGDRSSQAQKAVSDRPRSPRYARASAAIKAEFGQFIADNADWLEDFALFMALKDAHNGSPWIQWDMPLRARQKQALNEARKVHTSANRAFASPGYGPVGHVDAGVVRFRRKPERRAALPVPERLATVDLIRLHAGSDARFLRVAVESGARAVVLLNKGETPAEMTVEFDAIGLGSGKASVTDLWAHASLGSHRDRFTTLVEPHEGKTLKVKGTELPPPKGKRYLSDLPWTYAANRGH